MSSQPLGRTLADTMADAASEYHASNLETLLTQAGQQIAELEAELATEREITTSLKNALTLAKIELKEILEKLR